MISSPRMYNFKIRFNSKGPHVSMSVSEDLDIIRCNTCSSNDCRHALRILSSKEIAMKSIFPSGVAKFDNWWVRTILPFMCLAITFEAVAIPLLVWRKFELRFVLEQDGEIIAFSRDFRRYIVKPNAQVVYSFNHEGVLCDKHQYITQRLDERDDATDDLREFCMVVEVGIKLPISPQEKERYGTVRLN